jgi:phosphoribosylformylglycinamidine synthase PurS subunit
LAKPTGIQLHGAPEIDKTSEEVAKNMEKENKLSHAVVYVKLKDGVLDPQGSTIKRALENMGYHGIKDIRSGKVFEIAFQQDQSKKPEELINEICRKLLTNPVIEKYNFEILK